MFSSEDDRFEHRRFHPTTVSRHGERPLPPNFEVEALASDRRGMERASGGGPVRL